MADFEARRRFYLIAYAGLSGGQLVVMLAGQIQNVGLLLPHGGHVAVQGDLVLALGVPGHPEVHDTPGVEVRVGERLLGTSPFPERVWVTPGSRRFEATKENHEPATRTVELRAGEEATVRLAPQALPAEGTLVVTASKIANVRPKAGSRAVDPLARTI